MSPQIHHLRIYPCTEVLKQPHLGAECEPKLKEKKDLQALAIWSKNIRNPKRDPLL